MRTDGQTIESNNRFSKFCERALKAARDQKYLTPLKKVSRVLQLHTKQQTSADSPDNHEQIFSIFAKTANVNNGSCDFIISSRITTQPTTERSLTSAVRR